MHARALRLRGHQHVAAAARPLRAGRRTHERGPPWTPTTVTTANKLEIRVERIFDAPRAHVFSVWTQPELIPEWWGDEHIMRGDGRPSRRHLPGYRPAFGVVEGEFREVEPPERLVQSFQNHLRSSTLPVRGHRRAEAADADNAFRDDPGARHHDAVRRRGGREERLRADRRGAGEDRSVKPRVRTRR